MKMMMRLTWRTVALGALWIWNFCGPESPCKMVMITIESDEVDKEDGGSVVAPVDLEGQRSQEALHAPPTDDGDGDDDDATGMLMMRI